MRRVRRRGEQGSATAEFAVALPAVVLVVGLVLGVAARGVEAVRAQHAANEAARVAIADTPAAARDAGRAIAGPGAVVTVERDGAWWMATVNAPASWGGAVHARAISRAQD